MTRRRSPVAVLLLLAFAAGGCTVSNVDGPQLRDVPTGFGFDETASSSRRVFDDRAPLSRRGYFFRSDGGNASILMTELGRVIEEDEVESTYERLEEEWERSGAVFSQLESLTVDDRDAWGWFQRLGRSRRFVLVVPYDDVTFVIDFYSSVRGEQDEEFMRRHAMSFGRDPRHEGRQSALFGLGSVVAAGLLLAWWFRRQRQYRRRR